MRYSNFPPKVAFEMKWKKTITMKKREKNWTMRIKMVSFSWTIGLISEYVSKLKSKYECSAAYWARDNRKRLVCAQCNPIYSQLCHATTLNRTGWDGIKCVDISTRCNRLLFPFFLARGENFVFSMLVWKMSERDEKKSNVILWTNTYSHDGIDKNI